MNPMLFIRTGVFKATQKTMADIAGVTQATVSRWETGGLEPSRDDMERIRAVALERGIRWRDAWFFDAPVQAA